MELITCMNEVNHMS